MGLLTKIFGGPEGGAGATDEPSSATPATSPAAEAALPALPAYTKGDAGNSGIRPAVDPAAARARDAARASVQNRRPEHPRMYLRATPAAIDPTLPGSTRRQQISVRPQGKDAVSRAPAPPSKRTERMGSGRSAEESNRRDPRAEPTPPGLRLPRTRPRPTMVVSPVSLTPEQLALPPGARQKMQTLVGLGAAIGEVLAPDSSRPDHEVPSSGVATSARAANGQSARARSSDGAPVNGSAAHAGVGARGRSRIDSLTSFERGAIEVDADAPSLEHRRLADPDSSSGRELPRSADAAGIEGAVLGVADVAGAVFDAGVLEPAVSLLADFALKLALGPISGAWAAAARHAIEVVRPVAEQRQQDRLRDVLERVLGSLPSDPSIEPVLSGTLREGLVRELTELAGLVPEWPAAARDLSEEARRREVRVVRELLLAVDGTRRDQRARLEQHVRLDTLGTMNAEALASELVAPVERGVELRRVLDAYLGARRAGAPDVGNRAALESAIEQLEHAARAFDDADTERKDLQRELRAARRDAMTAVNLLLAERGEHEWLELLEPLSVAERIERLKQWLGIAREDENTEGSNRE